MDITYQFKSKDIKTHPRTKAIERAIELWDPTLELQPPEGTLPHLLLIFHRAGCGLTSSALIKAPAYLGSIALTSPFVASLVASKDKEGNAATTTQDTTRSLYARTPALQTSNVYVSKAR